MSSTDASSKQWSGPGIMQTLMKLKPDSKLSQETLQKWWEEEYLPKMLETGIVKSACTWKAADPKYEHQNMIIYQVPDVAAMKSRGSELSDIPRTSDSFPTDGGVDDFIEFESRVYSLVQNYEVEPQSESSGSKIICAAMQPASGGEADLDAWYREEHNEQMSKEPGYKRTTRWSLLFQVRHDGKPPGGLEFFAMHEFGEGNKVGKDVLPLDPMTDWTKKCMSECKKIDAAVYELQGSFGAAKSS